MKRLQVMSGPRSKHSRHAQRGRVEIEAQGADLSPCFSATLPALPESPGMNFTVS